MSGQARVKIATPVRGVDCISTRRDLMREMLGGVIAGTGIGSGSLRAATNLAWQGPIGLQIGTVRAIFTSDPVEAQKQITALGVKATVRYTNDPLEALKQIAAIGYKELELAPNVGLAPPISVLRAAGLAAPSAYFRVPKAMDEWKRSIDLAKTHDLRYMTVGSNPQLDEEGWKKQIELLNQCGTLCHGADIQFCYHAHFREFAPIGNTTAYDMMLTHLPPNVLNMEMDVFWAAYAGADPVSYFRHYPGRFPLLHIKDLRKGVATSVQDGPSREGPSPFVPVGQGRIDWQKVLANAGRAGTEHIFVELDRADMPSIEAVTISFKYLKNLQGA